MAVSGLDLLRVGVVKVFTEIGCYDLDSDRGGWPNCPRSVLSLPAIFSSVFAFGYASASSVRRPFRPGPARPWGVGRRTGSDRWRGGPRRRARGAGREESDLLGWGDGGILGT